MENEAATDPLNDPTLVRWLADATGMDVTAVEKEMREAAERRAFVVDELLEAGYRGDVLLDVVLRLTALSPEDARALIRAHTADPTAT